jgi:hypothetical protein
MELQGTGGVPKELPTLLPLTAAAVAVCSLLSHLRLGRIRSTATTTNRHVVCVATEQITGHCVPLNYNRTTGLYYRS